MNIKMQIIEINGDSIPLFDKVGIIVPVDKGEIFVLPTDTQWGMGVSPNFPRAIKKVFAIKQRPLNMPLPLFAASYEKAVELIGGKPSLLFRKLSDAFWPGALTIITKSEREFNEGLFSDGSKIGIRIPNHPVTLEIIRASREGYLAVTSVNRHDKPVLTSVEEIANEFGDDIHFLVNNNRKMTMKPSTVVDISGDDIEIIREGEIPAKEINRVISM